MEAIFHEQQEGSLCAQHCLNSLLQGQFYSAVDLAELAQELDGLEMAQMASAGESAEYRQFLQQPSINMDDSGFFSLQVISQALAVWGLELVAYSSSDPLAVRARHSPLAATAYICNYREHWFTIRRLGSQWFNLNSLLEYPELVSNTYLGEFLAQLQQEGYSIFIVKGQLPECDADLVLQAVPAVQVDRPRLLREALPGISSRRGGATPGPSGATSLPGSGANTYTGAANRDEEADLEAAMLLSLAENIPGPVGGPATINKEELELALAMFKDADMEMAMALSQEDPELVPQVSEEDDIQKAISLSLSGHSSPFSSSGQPTSFSPTTAGSSDSAGWGTRLAVQDAAEEERLLAEAKKEQEEEEEQLRQALALSLQGDTRVEQKQSSPKHVQTCKPSPLVKTTSAPPTLPLPRLVKTTSAPTTLPLPKLGGTPQKTPSSPGSSSLSGQAQPNLESRGQGQLAEFGGHTLGGVGSVRRPEGEADPAEIRRRRLEFLEKMQKTKNNQ